MTEEGAALLVSTSAYGAHYLDLIALMPIEVDPVSLGIHVIHGVSSLTMHGDRAPWE